MAVLRSTLLQDIASIFERERGRLLSIAYALLGSHAEAEDALQEAWVRLLESEVETRSPEAWLTTVVSRIALDRLKSAQHKREAYPGVWLPEPVSDLPDPEAREETRSMLSVGFLHLLEKLSPEERAVLVLREAFDRSFGEIANTLHKSEAACRQLLSRARRRLQDQQNAPPEAASQTLVEQCVEALNKFDEVKLLSLLADDAVFYGDGGGRVPSVLNPLYGADKILRFFLGLRNKYEEAFRFEMTRANGEPAILVEVAGRIGVLAMSTTSGKIAALYQINNPDKLTAFARRPLADAPEARASQ